MTLRQYIDLLEYLESHYPLLFCKYTYKLQEDKLLITPEQDNIPEQEYKEFIELINALESNPKGR